MSTDDHAKSAMRLNILEMALGFTAMIRVFSPQSNQQIIGKLCDLVAGLHQIHTKGEFDDHHQQFCTWFCNNIRTAERRSLRGGITPSMPTSFGQAAKVLDISLKVIIHYCALPSAEVAHRLLPLLHGAIDTPNLKYLRLQPPDKKVKATRIIQIDAETYQELQLRLKRDLNRRFGNRILPVEYDDILWRDLNRSSSPSILPEITS